MRAPHKRDEQGLVAIELVLCAPFLVALIFSIASFGSWFSTKAQVTGEAREVARAYALRDPNAGAASKRPSGATISSLTTCAAGDTTNDAVVTLTFDGDGLVSVPGVPLNPPDITATARFRCAGAP